MDRQAHRQRDRQTDRKERHIGRQTDTQTYTHTLTDRQTVHTYIQTDGHTHIHRVREKKQTDTETELLTFHGLIVPLFVVVIDDHGAKVGLDIGQGLVRNEGSMLLTNVIKLFTAVSCNFS
jgi:hypothetical protein